MGKEERLKQQSEVRLKWECSMSCGWEEKPKLELFQVLRLFGEHNLEKHKGTTQAHVVEVIGNPRFSNSRPKKRQYTP